MGFPASGILSLRSGTEGASGIEIAMVGREGLVGWDNGACPRGALFPIVGTVAGEVLVISAGEIQEVRAEAPELFEFAALSLRPLLMQMADTTLGALRRTVAERLARWLLMGFDRVDGEAIKITHEALATALGVRRPGITVATHELEGAHAIRAERGVIKLRDRQTLETLARGSYGGPEREYSRLFGGAGRVSPVPNELGVLNRRIPLSSLTPASSI